MQKITMFTMASCPFCKEAHRWMDELRAENLQYAALNIETIDETKHPEIAEKYDYYYVPTYFVGEDKKHEGAASKEKIRAVFDAALAN